MSRGVAHRTVRSGVADAWARRGFATLAALALAAWSGIADARVQIDLVFEPPNPQAGEIITIRYGVRVTNEGEVQIAPLDFGSLELLSDNAPPQLPSMWGGGGYMTIESAREYNVRAPSPGRYVVRGARVINAMGRVVAQHPDLVIVVTGGAAGTVPGLPGVPGINPVDPDAGAYTPAPPPVDPEAPPTGDLQGAEYNPTAFVRIALDPPRPYMGQQATLRAWLYVASTEATCDVQREPRLTGFWSESLLPPTQECAVRWFAQNVAGRYMSAGLVRRLAVFPSQAGRLTLGAMQLNVDVVTGGMFRSMQRVSATSPELVVEVREPPVDGSPADFVPGTVGPITLVAEIDRDELAVGETATITLRATSEGSMAAAAIRIPEHIDGLRIRDAGARSTRDHATGRIVTTLIDEVLVVADRPGRYELGEVTLPYWDANAERYDIARVRLPTFTATGAALRSDNSAARTDPSLELRPLSSRPSLDTRRALLPRGRWLWLLLWSPAALFAFASASSAAVRAASRRARERRDESRTDPLTLLDEARRRSSRAPREALTFAGRALERAVIAARNAAEDGWESIPEDVRDAVDEARRVCDAGRFAGAEHDADEVVRAVERAIRALESVP